MSSPQEMQLFHWADYLLFAISLASTLLIGAVFAIKDRWHKQTTESYLMGNRRINFIGVGLSILASTLNAVFLVGGVAEVHYQGTDIVYGILGSWIGSLIACHIFLPKFRHLDFKLTSAYEYLEKRFHLAVRMAAAAVFIITMLGYLAVVLSAPSLVFAQVSHIKNLYLTVVITGIICTLYTGFGGIKAVVWTDSIQMVILTVGLIALPVIGYENLGGLSQGLSYFKEGKRVIFDDFDWSFWNRQTFWNLTIGQGILQLALMASNQMIIQRVMTVKTLGRSLAAVYISQILFGLMFFALVLIGAASYATYRNCEPLFARKIERADQIVSLFIMEVLGHLPGIPGLVIAGIFAAALSTVSSAVNSMAAVFLEDIVKPIYERGQKKKLTETQSGWICRILGLTFGIISVAVAIGAVSTGQLLVPLIQTSYTMMGAPLFGVFLLGFFFPIVEWIGALVGLLGSLAIGLFMISGSYLWGHAGIGNAVLPLVFNKTICMPSGIAYNITAAMTTPANLMSTTTEWTTLPLMTTEADVPPLPTRPTPIFFDLSYQWWAGIIVGSCVILGVVTSLIVRGVKVIFKVKGHEPDPGLLYTRRDPYCYCPGDRARYRRNKGKDIDHPTHNSNGDVELRAATENTGELQYKNPAFYDEEVELRGDRL